MNAHAYIYYIKPIGSFIHSFVRLLIQLTRARLLDAYVSQLMSHSSRLFDSHLRPTGGGQTHTHTAGERQEAQEARPVATRGQ